MDWNDPDAVSNLWVFPRGIARNGGAGKSPIIWTSKYGSVGVSFYDAGLADGMNEKGLVANLLYLAESVYGDEDQRGKPTMSIGAWAQYFLDNFQSVAEAVKQMKTDPVTLISPVLPNGKASTVHLSISDASGDSAIFEFVEGKLVIHHSREYVVMTNSPVYEEQLAINNYWKLIGGTRMLPGTTNPADRYVRASYFLESSPKFEDPKKAIASVFSQMRSIGVPLGLADPDHPNLSSTLWRTVHDHDNLHLYFESTLRPFVFWVDLKKVNFTEGAEILCLETETSTVLAGEVSSYFSPSTPFSYLVA